MEGRKIQLVFDDNVGHIVDIAAGVPQGSPVSPILFLIYAQDIHPVIKIKYDTDSMSFVDDVGIYVINKTIQENCHQLIKILKTLFNWAADNGVKFDDDKSELIHFDCAKKGSEEPITLPNGTILLPKQHVKYLGIWLDRKLNFKKHVDVRIANATRALYAIIRLMHSEYGLKPNAARQLYLACITPISDYGSEIWYSGQKSFESKFAKLQNLAMRKILSVFRSSSVEIMQIECNLLQVKLRILQKNQKFGLRIAKIGN